MRAGLQNRYHPHVGRVWANQEILPRFGLAFLVDDQDATWTVTMSTNGPGLDKLRTGQRVHLTLEHDPEFSAVRAYDPQN